MVHHNFTPQLYGGKSLTWRQLPNFIGVNLLILLIHKNMGEIIKAQYVRDEVYKKLF